MKIALLGATSEIARDMIERFDLDGIHELFLFSRSKEAIENWVKKINLKNRFCFFGLDEFSLNVKYDILINFIGSGDPLKTSSMGSSIIEITQYYDDVALSYISKHNECVYIFISSGAVYGSSFDAPVNADTKAVIDINKIQPQDWYGLAKLHAECRHRSLIHLSIVDIRIFNYFSSTQDMNARFLITDIIRAINDKSLLTVSSDNIYRDYLHPSDFYQLVCKILAAPRINTAVDCYTKAPIDKINLLMMLHKTFSLRYEFSEANTIVNATGNKPYYYSLNRRAADFGYLPNFTSLEGVLQEANAICKNK